MMQTPRVGIFLGLILVLLVHSSLLSGVESIIHQAPPFGNLISYFLSLLFRMQETVSHFNLFTEAMVGGGAQAYHTDRFGFFYARPPPEPSRSRRVGVGNAPPSVIQSTRTP
ncbi:hypothetical protein AMTR_s00061p00125000 [Amborella trichopoda]|uniref:Uncharacterized protein n=1 Tax=Amborella trichopoda TaxID=13333 RepID=U5D0H4_AMBTC|nr:hypothetical protein AMTR_s00061p00125000 [Amborella trichopoda]